jgi:hypothetical protein
MPTADYAVSVGGKAPAARITSQTTTGFVVQCRSLPSGDVADNSFAISVNATNATLPSTFTEAQIQSVLDFIAVANPAGVAKAWGNVTGGGTVTEGLNASGSRPSTGTYAIVFDTPMSSADYSVQVTTIGDIGSPSITAYDLTTTGFSVRTNNASGVEINRAFSFTVHSN